MALRAPLREEKQLLLLWGAAAAGSLVFRGWLLRLSLHFPPCPFRTLTGLPCLTCGTGRAGRAFLHGDLATALHFNPLSTVAALVFLAGGLLGPLWVLLGLPVPERLALSPLQRGLVVAILAAAWGWQIARGI